MINLFKTNGELKHRNALIAHYRDAIIAKDREAWDKAREEEYATLYPLMRDMTQEEMDAYGVVPVDYVYPQVPMESEVTDTYPTYDEWINETVVVQAYAEPTYDENGIELTPEVPEITEPVRPYTPPTVTEADLDAYLSTNSAYKGYLDGKKDGEVNQIIVTTASGKRFYADPISRSDIADAIAIGQQLGQTVTAWKTPDGWMDVTIDEMIEARMLGLQAKGDIIARY